MTGVVVVTQLGDRWIAVPFPTRQDAEHWLRDNPGFHSHGILALVTRHDLHVMGAA